MNHSAYNSWLSRTLHRLATPFRFSRRDLSLNRGWGRWLDLLLILQVAGAAIRSNLIWSSASLGLFLLGPHCA